MDTTTAAFDDARLADAPAIEPGWIVQSGREWMNSADFASDLTCLVDDHGRVLYSNHGIERWNLIDDAAKARGQLFHGLLHPGCTADDCAFAGLAAEIARVRRDDKVSVREVHDAILDRQLKVIMTPVVVMPRHGGDGIGAAVVRLVDAGIPTRTEQWLQASVDELNVELRKRTAALERATEAEQRAETALRRSESEFRLLSAALMTMQEMERKRIATELHDSIGQSLSAVGFGVGVALDAARGGDARVARTMLEKLAAQVRESVGEVRRIAMDLRPTTLDDIGIVATLSWFFREFRAIHPGITLQTDVTLYEEDVSPQLKTAIFRVVQEATNNVVKHARATEVRVRLWRVDHEIHLEVADNGRGFKLADTARGSPSTSGMGLMGMRDRAEFAGGSFDLESEPGKGTRISVSWPLNAD